jgi:hypothetical protein
MIKDFAFYNLLEKKKKSEKESIRSNEELIKTLLSGTTTNQEYVGFKKYLISILNTKPHYKDYLKLFD